MHHFRRFDVRQISEHGADLFEALRLHRFAILRLDDASVSQLDMAVQLFAQRQTFRFPPHDESPSDSTPPSQKSSQEPSFLYTDLEADCFNALYALCRDCLLSIRPLLPNALPDPPHGPVVRPPSSLPFAEGLQAANPYRASFFNMFNYDHGSLNRHFDRGLLTINYGFPSPAPLDALLPRSQLWLRSYSASTSDNNNDDGQWLSADQLLIDDPKHEALLLVGEQLEQASNGVLCAGEHSVRVDPNGERLAYSHQRKDPAATPGHNRLSTAMIFSVLT